MTFSFILTNKTKVYTLSHQTFRSSLHTFMSHSATSDFLHGCLLCKCMKQKNCTLNSPLLKLFSCYHLQECLTLHPPSFIYLLSSGLCLLNHISIIHMVKSILPQRATVPEISLSYYSSHLSFLSFM